MVDGMCLSGTVALNIVVREKQQFYFWPIASIILGFAFTALIFSMGAVPLFERILVGAIPGVIILVFIFAIGASGRLSRAKECDSLESWSQAPLSSGRMHTSRVTN